MNQHSAAQRLGARSNLLILLPAFAALLLGALWAAVFYLVSASTSKALAQQHETSMYLWWGMAGSTCIIAFVALLMVQSHRLRVSELAARNAQAIYAAAAEGGLDAFCILKAVCGADHTIHDFLITAINARGATLFAKPKSQIIGHKLCEFLPFIRTSGLFDKYMKVLESGDALEEELEIDTPDINARWIRQQIIAIDGGVAVTTRDISARKSAEMQTRNSRAFLQSLIDYLPVMIYARSMQQENYGRMIVWNKAAEIISGYSAEQVLGHTNSDAFPANLADQFEALHRQIIADPQVVDIPQAPFEQKEGGQRFLHAIAVPLFDENNRIEYILGIAEDITARHEAEQALRDSEARLRTITDALPALISYVDANQHYRFNNIAYEARLGLSRDEMRNKPVRELLGETLYARVAPYIQRALQGEKVNFELEEQDEDAYHCVELTYIPQFSSDGQQVLGFHVMNQDITAKKLEERRLLQLAQVDSLTGLANRTGFLQRLTDAMAQSKASQALIALMYLDIDHFKPINDTYGHPVGDALLKAFVGRLARTLRASDTVARLGGDEFTVIMGNLSRPEDAATVAAKIVQAIQPPFSLDDDRSVSVSISIGLAFYQGGATDRKTLIRQADEMLYLAKQAGRNTYRVAPLPGA